MGLLDFFTGHGRDDQDDAYEALDENEFDDDDEDEPSEVISQAAAEERYRDSLDESGAIRIGEVDYDVSRVLEAVDPIAYRVGLSDYHSFLEEDGYVIE